jgi:hypothetical protein
MGAVIKRSKRARRKVAQTRLERIDGISMQINSIGAVQVFDLHNAVAVVRLIGDGRSLDGESCKIGSWRDFSRRSLPGAPGAHKGKLDQCSATGRYQQIRTNPLAQDLCSRVSRCGFPRGEVFARDRRKKMCSLSE